MFLSLSEQGPASQVAKEWFEKHKGSLCRVDSRGTTGVVHCLNEKTDGLWPAAKYPIIVFFNEDQRRQNPLLKAIEYYSISELQVFPSSHSLELTRALEKKKGAKAGEGAGEPQLDPGDHY